ncbi:MAG: ATP-binding protein [Rhizobiaceae bacterium]
MFVERAGNLGEETSQERRDTRQPDSRVLGRVVQCDGARARLAAFAHCEEAGEAGLWTVGRLISINLGDIRTVGLVYRIQSPDGTWNESDHNPIIVDVELIGEVRDTPDGKPFFDRGITRYPHVGAISHRIRARDLAAVYELGGRKAVTIGSLSQDASIEARIAIDDTMSRHFAIVGTTGVGKSTAVSLFVRKAVAARPDLRVLILDPHNEFSAAFPDKSIRVDTTTLELPFWLFRLEELVEVLFRGREAVPEEVDLLRDFIPQAKQMYGSSSASSVIKRSTGPSSLTADTPVPYRIADVIRLIDDRIGLLDAKNERPALRSLRARIEGAMKDPRYRFMFASRMIEDNIHQTIGKIFRVPHENRPITCFELAGLPSEVVNSICSVLSRLAFDIARGSNGRLKLLVLCEEAHRYMPADPSLGFAPTRHALSRIAKEGRKYGCYLGVITQRPGELDPTVLSQCSTIFAMRLANERDQEIIRSAIADSSASTLSFLSAMGQREAIAFGEGVATTMRLRFEQMDPALLPGSALKRETGDVLSDGNDVDLYSIVSRLRTTGRVVEPDPVEADVSDAAAQIARAVSARPDSLRRSPGRREDDHAFRRLYE